MRKKEKTKIDFKKFPQLFVIYEEEHETIENTFERESWSGRNYYQINYKVIDVIRTQPQTAYHEQVPLFGELKDLQKVYCVIVRWGSGGTFSKTSGYGKPIGCFSSYDEAEKCREAIQKWKTEKDYLNYVEFVFWDDYFGGLEDVEIESFVV